MPDGCGDLELAGAGGEPGVDMIVTGCMGRGRGGG